jgi:hypothetical protein
MPFAKLAMKMTSMGVRVLPTPRQPLAAYIAAISGIPVA